MEDGRPHWDYKILLFKYRKRKKNAKIDKLYSYDDIMDLIAEDKTLIFI